MSFAERVYKETSLLHKEIDRHSFVSLIKVNKKAGNKYINFNKICIYIIQQYISMDNVLFKKLYREVDIPDIFISITLTKLLNRCKKYPLEHAYQFYLGLISGGNILKKYISDEHDQFLSYEAPKKLSSEFKEYLNSNVKNQDEFIEIVKESYKLIKVLFDEFI